MYLDIEGLATLGALRQAEIRQEVAGAHLARQARQVRRARAEQAGAEGASGAWAPLTHARTVWSGAAALLLARSARP